jgi:beta-hydroxylase
MNTDSPPGPVAPDAFHPPSRDLADRTIRLKPPRNSLERLALRAKDACEAFVARRSRHPDRVVYPTEWFPWTGELEAGWRSIRAELDALLERRSAMAGFHDILAPVATITRDQDWKTFFLQAPGMDCRENRALCPNTCRLLEQIPDLQTAMFSILSPGKHIPAHRGAFNGLLRYHLGLRVPEPSDQCRIRIGNEWYPWSEGSSLVFDDTFNHEVRNETNGIRVVLFVDFLRPLRRPWHDLNRGLMRLAAWTPPMRAANRSQREWARRFHQAGPGDH